jgi:hypothetical protein
VHCIDFEVAYLDLHVLVYCILIFCLLSDILEKIMNTKIQMRRRNSQHFSRRLKGGESRGKLLKSLNLVPIHLIHNFISAKKVMLHQLL